MTTKEFEENMQYIMQEGYLSQLFMGLNPNNRQDIVTTFKKHSNEKYLNAIRSCKKIEDLEYLRRDSNMGDRQLKIIYDRMVKCEKLGYCKETEKYYDGIKKLYIDKGVKSTDVEATIKWMKIVPKQEINKRMKELKGQHK